MGEFKATSSVIVRDYSGAPIIMTSGAGLNVTQNGNTLRIGSVALTDASGGTSLGSGVIRYGIQIKSVSGTVCWIGGSGTGLAPFSGTGYPLFSGQSMILNVNNVSNLRGVGPLSGIVVNWIGMDV